MIQLMYRCDFCPRTCYAMLEHPDRMERPEAPVREVVIRFIPAGWELGARGLACWQCVAKS